MIPHGSAESLTMAAQAARRRRVQGRTPPSTSATLPMTSGSVSQQQNDRSSSHAAASVPLSAIRAGERNDTSTLAARQTAAAGDSLLDRSMEVGEEVQSLLASVRKTVKGTTRKPEKSEEEESSTRIYRQSNSNQERRTTTESARKAAAEKPEPLSHQRASTQPDANRQSITRTTTRPEQQHSHRTVAANASRQPSSSFSSDTRDFPSQTQRKPVIASRDLPPHASTAQPATSSYVHQEEVILVTSPTPTLSRRAAAPDARNVEAAVQVSTDAAAASNARQPKARDPAVAASSSSSQKPSTHHHHHTQQTTTTTPAKLMTTSKKPASTNTSSHQTLTTKSALKKKTVAAQPWQLLKQAEIVYDAACFQDHALVMIQSFANAKTLSAAAEEATDNNNNNNKDWVAAEVDGKGLGQTREVLRLAIRGGYRDSSRPLSFGDRITVSTSDNRLLGVRRSNNDENDPVAADHATFQVGFFPRSSSSSSANSSTAQQQWVVFPANETVKVGRAALDETIITKALPVKSGQAVILRNCQTGGVLSCHDNALKLVTDAHLQPVVADPDSDEEVVNRDGAPSLMTRLQRSDRLVPSENDMFCFRQSASPLTPLWISTRCFMDGSYLWHTDRHNASLDTEKMDRMLFGDNNSNFDQNAMLASSREQMQTPRGQELVLLDEFIGACMGLDGHFIKAIVTTRDIWGLQFELVGTQFDVMLRQVVQELLPLPTCFARVRRFVSQHTPGYEYGSVMQAFCEALDHLLEKHFSTVISWQKQFRQNDLSMRDLQVLVQSSVHSLSIMEQACRAAQDKKGGALINAVRRLKLQSHEGDGVADGLLEKLLSTSAEPFLNTLSGWLENGVLSDDPHEEFMIRRCKTQPWESKYEISTENVLEGFFSTKQTVERVLAAGRYWNAVRSCDENNKIDKEAPDRKDNRPIMLDLNYSTSTADVSLFVQTMYNKASNALVGLLLKKDEYDLMGALRLMKRFFLLEYGDFFVNFLDKAESELLKDVSHLSRNRIQHWMNSLIQFQEHQGGEGEGLAATSILSRRKTKPTGLRCRFSTEALTDHLDKLHAASGGIDTHEPWTPMRHVYGGGIGSSDGDLTGLDTFFLDFATVPFPISLVISQSAMECYQLLFRHLFFAKYVERRLVSIWKDHQAMKELQALRGLLGPTFLLRQRMLHFLQNLMYYMMFEVIEPNWMELESAIGSPNSRKERTVDDILRDHSQFLHRVLEACLLTDSDVIRALTKLMKTCLLFSEQMKRFMKATKFDEDRHIVATEMQNVVHRNLNERGGARSSGVSAKFLRESMKHTRTERVKRVQRQTARVKREVSSESYQRMITRFEEVFSENLREFMVQLTSSNDSFHTHKVNLAIRLDYNGFSSSSLGLS